MAVVLLSKDPPEVQRKFAQSRNWNFRLASHGGGDYIREQTVMEGQSNMPGAVVFEQSDGHVFRRMGAVFGPGDQFLSGVALSGDGWNWCRRMDAAVQILAAAEGDGRRRSQPAGMSGITV